MPTCLKSTEPLQRSSDALVTFMLRQQTLPGKQQAPWHEPRQWPQMVPVPCISTGTQEEKKKSQFHSRVFKIKLIRSLTLLNCNPLGQVSLLHLGQRLKIPT